MHKATGESNGETASCQAIITVVRSVSVRNLDVRNNWSVSDRTVENNVLHILAKSGVESRTAAAIYAVRHGLA